MKPTKLAQRTPWIVHACMQVLVSTFLGYLIENHALFSRHHKHFIHANDALGIAVLMVHYIQFLQRRTEIDNKSVFL